MDPVTRSPARALVGGVLSVIELWGRGQVGNALGTYSDEVNWGGGVIVCGLGRVQVARAQIARNGRSSLGILTALQFKRREWSGY